MAVSTGSVGQAADSRPKGGLKTAAEKMVTGAFNLAIGSYLLLLAYLWFGAAGYAQNTSMPDIFIPGYLFANAVTSVVAPIFNVNVSSADSNEFIFWSVTMVLLVMLFAGLSILTWGKKIASRAVSVSAEAVTSADAYFRNGEALLGRGDYAGAIGEFNAALKKRPGYPGASYNLGRCYMALGNYSVAAAWLQKELELQPASFDALASAGYCDLRLGRFASAEKALEKATVIRPDSAQAHLWLGDARRLAGKYPEADSAYQKAVGVDRDLEGLDLALGENYLKMDRLDDAIAVLRSAVSRNPRQDRTHYLLGLTLAKKGRYDEAIAEYNAALLLNPAEKTYTDMLEVAKAALRDASVGPAQKEIVREIVKVPCKYCGTLIEITCTKCPSCGAPLK